jgi:hypothetical protein
VTCAVPSNEVAAQISPTEAKESQVTPALTAAFTVTSILPWGTFEPARKSELFPTELKAFHAVI